MSATIRQIVDEATKLVGEVAGVGVQQYDEDNFFDNTVRAFDTLFTKYRWPQYRKWFRFELDGTLGVINDADGLAQVRQYEDIIAVYRDGLETPMPVFPGGMNPYQNRLAAGSQALYWDSLHVSDANYEGCKLQFYPKTATGFINVWTMLYPLLPEQEGWAWSDVLYLDRGLLVYATAFATLSGDDLNPEAKNVCEGMMNERYGDIMNNMSEQPIPIKTRDDVPSRWTTRW